MLKKNYFSGGQLVHIFSILILDTSIILLSLDLLKPNNIAGTVAASIADIDFVKTRNGVENLFEDGTLSFLSIATISHGFKILNTLTMSAITRYVFFFFFLRASIQSEDRFNNL